MVQLLHMAVLLLLLLLQVILSRHDRRLRLQ
jgi:hypothetical protein